MTCYFQGTHAAPSPPTSAPIISAAPHVWCDRARFSLSRSMAWTCRGQPTTRQSAPSGMQEAASGWHFWETGFHLERCQTLVDPRTSGPSQGNSRQTRRARRPRPLWWRAQRAVCPRALRQLSAMAMTLWVICWNMTVFHRTSCTIFTHCVSSLCVQPERANETNQVLSKLRKDSLQDGKHTMGVSNLFSDSQTIRNKKRLRKYTSLHTVGRMHTLFHGFLSSFLDPPHPSHSIMWQIPRIILTHPSTSDEDVELVTQSPSTEQQHNFDILDRCVYFDNAFYPPWPRPHEAPGLYLCQFFLFQHGLFFVTQCFVR